MSLHIPSSLRHRRFRLLWIGSFISFAGSRMQFFALLWHIRQLKTPDRLRGRMSGISQLFFMGGPQLGEFEAATVAQFFGAPFAVISGGLLCIISVGLVAKRWPQLGQHQGYEQNIEPSPS